MQVASEIPVRLRGAGASITPGNSVAQATPEVTLATRCRTPTWLGPYGASDSARAGRTGNRADSGQHAGGIAPELATSGNGAGDDAPAEIAANETTGAPTAPVANDTAPIDGSL